MKWRSGSHREPWLHVGNWGATAAFVTLLNILPLSLLKAWFTNTTKALGSTCKKQSISWWSGSGPASRYHVRRWPESCCTALTSRRGCILSREEARDVKSHRECRGGSWQRAIKRTHLSATCFHAKSFLQHLCLYSVKASRCCCSPLDLTEPDGLVALLERPAWSSKWKLPDCCGWSSWRWLSWRPQVRLTGIQDLLLESLPVLVTVMLSSVR